MPMGTWGTGIYDNDDAADWAAELSDGGLEAVESAFDAVLDLDYIDAGDAACAVAAADVVARLTSGRGDDSPHCEAVVEWVSTHPSSPPPTLVAKALRALTQIGGESSELAELWSDNSADEADWRATLTEIANRLNPGAE